MKPGKAGKPGAAPSVNPAAQRPAPKGSHMAPSDAKGGSVQPPVPSKGTTPTAQQMKNVPPKKSAPVPKPGVGYPKK